MSRTRRAACGVLLAGTVVAAGVSGCGSSGGEKPEKTGPTVTRTQTVTPRTTTKEPTPSRTPSPTPSRTTPPPTADAASTVEAYFDAINAHDYRRAWELGGKNLGGSYASFQAGFAETVRDTVHIAGVQGSVVTVTLDALQTDGTVRTFAGNYTVRGGAIVGADIREVTSPTPESPEPTAPEETSTSYPPGPPPGIPDVDCSDLPGPVVVGPSDPHDLDRDGDGIGCEANE